MAKRGREVEAELRMFEAAWGTFCHGLSEYLKKTNMPEVARRMGRWGEYLREEIEGCPLRRDFKDDYFIRLETLRTEIVDMKASIGMVLSILGEEVGD